jgi:hypothetical protein
MKHLNFSQFIVLIVIILITVSCQKSGSTASGEDAVRYASEDYYEMNVAPLVFTGNIQVENAAPYRDIMGDLMSDAWTTDIDGKGVAMTGLKLFDCAPQLIELRIESNIDSMLYYFESARLVLAMNGQSNSSIILGESVGINIGNRVIEFNIASTDVCEFLATNRPDEMYFEFTLNDERPIRTPLQVKYEIHFGYSFEYEESKP